MVKARKVNLIAEIGINHGGSLKRALDLVKSAKKAGADIVKFQTYNTEKRFAQKKNKQIFKILKNCELSFEDFKLIKKKCDNLKIEFSSTPFDEESAIFLNKLGVKKIKIASFDVKNTKFLKFLSNFNKLFILSTGMSNYKDIAKAVKIFKNKKRKLVLLHCVSTYPNKESDSELNCINSLKDFGVEVGLSDHTNDIFVPILSSTMGISYIEKHYMINKDKRCVDFPVSITEKQFLQMKQEINRVQKILGSSKLEFKKSEQNSKIFRRSS